MPRLLKLPRLLRLPRLSNCSKESALNRKIWGTFSIAFFRARRYHSTIKAEKRHTCETGLERLTPDES